MMPRLVAFCVAFAASAAVFRAQALATPCETAAAQTPGVGPSQMPRAIEQLLARAPSAQDVALFWKERGQYAELLADVANTALAANPDLAKLSKAEFLAVMLYTRSDHHEVNYFLREGDLGKFGDGEVLGAQLRLMVAGLRKLPDYRGVVHRGATFNIIYMNSHYVAGTRVFESGFSSTSKGGVVDLWQNSLALYEIQVVTGKDLSAFNAGEREVLLFPGWFDVSRVTPGKVPDQKSIVMAEAGGPPGIDRPQGP